MTPALAPGGRLDLAGTPAWDGLRVLVPGLGVSGAAAALALAERGAAVVAVDGRDTEAARGSGALLEVLGGRALLGDGARDALAGALPDVDGAAPDLVVTSPGWRPDNPLLAAAVAAGVPVVGEVQLAWWLRAEVPAAAGREPAPWLTVTGTNGKTTVTTMLAAVLAAAGQRVAAAGNIGTPLVEAVLDPDPPDALAVELSSFQLHWPLAVAPLASACLNVAPDHVDWHGSLAAYAADKARVYERTVVACVYNAADPATEQMVREATVQEGCRAVGTTLGVPAVGMLGVVEDVLADRAFVAERRTSAAELATLDDLAHLAGTAPSGGGVPPHTVANALAAAALARAGGASPAAVRAGLRATGTGAHRIARVAEAGGVAWVDDSKATNPHAAAASLAGARDVVWVAGGLAKGATYDDLVAGAADRLVGVVLIGTDRAPLREALARHAPGVPVVEVEAGDHGGGRGEGGRRDDGGAGGAGVMAAAVAAAARLARPGATVLLAPAAASMDQFADYAARGDAFAAAVRAHLRTPGEA